MAWKEISWSPWMAPIKRPLSCCGKKPFDTRTNRKTFSAMVASRIARVRGAARRAAESVRAVQVHGGLKTRSVAR